MERGNSKHGPMHDDELAKEMDGMLGQGSSNREDWREPELAVDDTDGVDPQAEPTTRQPGDPADDDRAVEA